MNSKLNRILKGFTKTISQLRNEASRLAAVSEAETAAATQAQINAKDANRASIKAATIADRIEQLISD